MTDFVSAADAAESASYSDQKAIRDEVADIDYRLRRAMDEGLTPDDMKVAEAERDAVNAANEILAQLFN